ncbi:hypothetical protein [Microlunatus parietis]|uniref:Uncharacterized protein n=1 Tax=Microlunatus parietis TaxID=682979 RepID=A0A7Y9IDW2_9ACTN|nr:hypothetical protein [Microlunatus parietis]NYE74932.1 hypothetical protein [Microlunatus parietis]
MSTREVVGIAVDKGLVRRWRDWFAPARQAFPIGLVPDAAAAAIPIRTMKPTAEWVDTFFMYGGSWTWFDESEFAALPARSRRALLAARRRTMRPKTAPVLWPSELARAGDEPMFSWIESGIKPSRHGEVPRDVWRTARRLLPEAERLAGTFEPAGSGPNCFGNVLAAAGVPDSETVSVGPGQFQTWLDEATEPVRGTGHDQEPGTVLVWTERGKLGHAVVTLGDGWVHNKPSQSWSSPRLVWTVTAAVHSWRFPGTKLHRYKIKSAT